MPITTTGRDVAFVLDERTRKYTFDWAADGNPRFSDDEEHATLLALYVRKNEYWDDLEGLIGSRLWSITTSDATTASRLEAYALEALQPLVDEQRIKGPPSLRAAAEQCGPTSFVLDIFYETPAGKSGSVRVPVGF